MKLVPSAIARGLAAMARQVVPFSALGRRFHLDEVVGPRTGQGMPIPVTFDTGISFLPRTHALGGIIGVPAPWVWHTYFTDFDTLDEFNGITDTATWDVTAGGAGTFALADGESGLALITNAAADDNSVFFQKKGESFKFAARRPLVFASRFKVSDAVQSDFICGLQITDTTPLDVTDGIFFQKDDGDALLDFHVEKANVASDAIGVATVVADTFLTVMFAYDGETKIYYGVDGVLKGFLPITNAPTTEEITVTFGVQNGEAVAKTGTWDYIFASQLTVR